MNIKRKKKLVIKLKLPKLSITKFEKLFENLLPFWNILVCRSTAKAMREQRTYSRENTAKPAKLSMRMFIIFWSSPS